MSLKEKLRALRKEVLDEQREQRWKEMSPSEKREHKLKQARRRELDHLVKQSLRDFHSSR